MHSSNLNNSNGCSISPKSDISIEQKRLHNTSTYHPSMHEGLHNAPTQNISPNNTPSTMHSAHHPSSHLNFNMSTVSADQSQNSHVHPQMVNIYSPIGQPYAAENSNFGAIYHNHHYGSYGSPYEKIKVSGHMRQMSSNSTTSSVGNSSVSLGGNHHYGYHHQPFYSPHQMIRSNGYLDLVPR